MSKPPELFTYERPTLSNGGRSDFAQGGGIPYALRRVITLLVLVGVIGGGVYWLWNRAPSTPAAIPTIKTEGSFKQRPEQPGGIDIPNQGVQVYREIDGSAQTSDQKPKVEHMLPPPEEPMASAMPSKPAAEPVVDEAAAHVERLTPTVTATSTVPAIDTPPPPPPMPTTVTAPVAKIDPPKPAVEKPVIVEKPAAPAVTASPPPVATAKLRAAVQLAALPDQAAAEALAHKLQNRYASILGTARLHPVRADLGAKGIFYRIQSQPLTDAEAQTLCDALKKEKAGCLLVHP